MRLLVENLEAASKIYPTNKIGVRLPPYGLFNDMSDSDPISLFTAVCTKIHELGIDYVNVIEPRSTHAGGGEDVVEGVRRWWRRGCS
jgi:N-ethylmaleimide reductase